MRHILFAILILSNFCIISCNSEVDKFYKTSHVEDIDVLPLIKPYRLWTSIPNQLVWHLDFKNEVAFEIKKKGKHLLETQINVCKINIRNGIIYGHCMDQNCYPNYYFAIGTNDSSEKAFEFKEDWYKYLQTYGINGSELYDVLEVYKAFKANYKTLPWYNEIKQR